MVTDPPALRGFHRRHAVADADVVLSTVACRPPMASVRLGRVALARIRCWLARLLPEPRFSTALGHKPYRSAPPRQPAGPPVQKPYPFAADAPARTPAAAGADAWPMAVVTGQCPPGCRAGRTRAGHPRPSRRPAGVPVVLAEKPTDIPLTCGGSAGSWPRRRVRPSG